MDYIQNDHIYYIYIYIKMRCVEWCINTLHHEYDENLNNFNRSIEEYYYTKKYLKYRYSKKRNT